MDKDKEKEEIQYFTNLVVTQTKEQLQKILNDFWLLDASEYSIIKDLIQTEIDTLDTTLQFPIEKTITSEMKHYSDLKLRDFYIVMKEKVDYIISNGLCKQYK